MKKVKKIQLQEGVYIYVEMEEKDTSFSDSTMPEMDLPEGVELTSASKKLEQTAELLKNAIRGTAEIVNEGIQKTRPYEWGLELNIGFKGKANAIPVILSGETDANIKVTAKWKR
jgi:hypothetical protein